MRHTLIHITLMLSGFGPVQGQSPVPLITSFGHLVVFRNGTFQDLEARRPQAVYQGGDKLAYLTDAGDLKLFQDGKVITLQNGEPVEVAVSKHLMAWKTGPSLRIPSEEGGLTLCRSVGRFTVGDSIIAFHDRMQQVLSVRWNGRTMPVADVLMTSEDVVWKSGSNTLLLYDLGHRQVLLFYRGRTSVLCNGTDRSRSEPGGDMVAFMDEFDDTFQVFDKGQVYDVQPFAPASFQVGNGLVAFVTGTGMFRCFQGGRVWDISDYAPDEYWVRDSVVIFRDRDNFKVFSGGAVENLERNMPSLWEVSGSMVVWLDVNGVLQLFHAGRRITVSKEAGLDHFELCPGAVAYKSRSGSSKVWWNGTLYEHY